jgi:hypothetical protein
MTTDELSAREATVKTVRAGADAAWRVQQGIPLAGSVKPSRDGFGVFLFWLLLLALPVWSAVFYWTDSPEGQRQTERYMDMRGREMDRTTTFAR